MHTTNQLNLDESLSALHFETQEWIREIQFNKSELNFLNDLITEMIGSSTIDDQQHKDIFRNINGLLDNLTNELSSMLKTHEKDLLSALKQINTVDKQIYYKAHSKSKKMNTIKGAISDLKAAIHDYINNNRASYRTEFLDLDV